jgi:hypothetical protein
LVVPGGYASTRETWDRLERYRKARAEHLKERVEDARAALSLATDHPTALTPAAAQAATLLKKIVSDDLDEEGPPPSSGPKRRGRPPNKQQQQDTEGAAQVREEEARVQTAVAAAAAAEKKKKDTGPRLRRGVAKDRTLSVVDPQMRVGHKSKHQSWAGYKVHIAEEPQSELITQV